jgi:hypothetical protein
VAAPSVMRIPIWGRAGAWLSGIAAFPYRAANGVCGERAPVVGCCNIAGQAEYDLYLAVVLRLSP